MALWPTCAQDADPLDAALEPLGHLGAVATRPVGVAPHRRDDEPDVDAQGEQLGVNALVLGERARVADDEEVAGARHPAIVAGPQAPEHDRTLWSRAVEGYLAPMRVSHEAPPPNRRRSLYAYLGLRPAYAEHSVADEALLRRLARSARVIVEIGSAEGTSALAMRQEMPADASLWCVDPYVSRIRGFSPRERVAHRVVAGSSNGTVTWVKAFSAEVGRRWTGPAVELLFVDGDHSFEGVAADWEAWSPHLADDAVVVFDDAIGAAQGWGPSRLLHEHVLVGGSGWRLAETGDRYAVVTRG